MKNLVYIIIVQLLTLLLVKDVNGWGGWEWFINLFKSKKNSADNGIGREIPSSISNTISEVAATGAVFLRDNVELNCLGLPTKLFAKTVDSMMSDTTKAEDVRFYFSSQDKPGYSSIKIEDDFTLDGTNFFIYRDTIVLVHGFMSSGREQWLWDMKDALLKYVCPNIKFLNYDILIRNSYLTCKDN